MDSIFKNTALWAAVISWTTAQLIKFFTTLFKTGKIDMRALTMPGGMPSGHAACMMALSVSVGLQAGWDSLLFAVTICVSLIIMYDAAGVRRAAGRHAAALNKIIDRLTSGSAQERKKLTPVELREILGHTPIQVFAGAALGIAVACLLYYK